MSLRILVKKMAGPTGYEQLKNSQLGRCLRALVSPYFWIVTWRKITDLLLAVGNPALLKLHLKLRQHLRRERKEWPHMQYGWGYFYQGWKSIGITGNRETNLRYDLYEMDKYLKPNQFALDIGANAGFFALKVAPRVKHVDAVEWNPYQCDIGREVAAYLKQTNITFTSGDFQNFVPAHLYNIIFSFANHHTDDGGMRPQMFEYLKNLHQLLAADGILLFESHPGDLKDNRFAELMENTQTFFAVMEKKKLMDCKDAGYRLFYVLKKIS